MGKGGRAPVAGVIAAGEPQTTANEPRGTAHNETVASSQQPADVLQLPQLQPFLAPDFDAAEFTSGALAASRTSAAAQAEGLRGGVRQLEAALSAHVLTHHDQLLGHVRRLAATEHALQDVVLSVAALSSALSRVRAEVEAPHAAVQAAASRLRDLHSTVQLLRGLSGRIKLVGKLRTQLDAAPGTLDLSKAARLLSDIRTLTHDADLAGLAAADADNAFLEAAASTVQDQAQVCVWFVGG